MNKTGVLAVIPARYRSSRFPGKALADIGGETILERLYRTAASCQLIDRVMIASDADEILSFCRKRGLDAIRTSAKHKTGSDRSAEVAQKSGGEIIVSIQADHWGESRSDFEKVIKDMLSDKTIKYATFVKRIESDEYLYDPNRVKVIFDRDNFALWFSRYPIPYLQGVNGNRAAQFDYYYHIGVYFFRRDRLLAFHRLPQSRLEKAESLEQLRILESQGRMKVFMIKSRIYSVDTREDLERLKRTAFI